jgi:glycosyltransferase involved in cell wall biosynthesis
MSSNNSLRVAWVLPVAWFYWQPVLSEFTRLFPDTTVFTGLFPGFAKGYENSLTVELVGKTKVVGLTKSETGYGDNFTYLSPAIIGCLLQLKPDVVFTSSFGIWTMLVVLLKPIGRWRVVIAYEGCSPGVDYRNSWLRLTLRRLLVAGADACITNSHAGKDYLTKFLKARDDSVFVKPYEIPVPEAFLSAVSNTKQSRESLNCPVFLFVGHIVPRKGLNFLLEACAILRSQGYSNYTILVVGDGSQQEELEAFCESHGLTDCVRWEGRVEYELIGSYFQMADAFILPTLEDTWGVVVLEAMLFGKPILCSKGAGTSELIVNGENGYVFEPQDVEALARLMRQLIDDPQLIVTMSEKSKQTMAMHTPKSASEVLTKIVNSLCEP